MMIKVLLIKFIYMLRIQMKQNITKKCENNGLQNLKDPQVFIEYPNKYAGCL